MHARLRLLRVIWLSGTPVGLGHLQHHSEVILVW